MHPPVRSNSEKIYKDLCETIPGGVNSPVRAFKSVGQLPLVAASGKEDLLFDADDHPYIDFCASWGALIHGHAHPRVVAAAQKQIAKGSSFGMTTEIEGKLARTIISVMPSIEKIRFVSSGTEATMSAIRLVRAFTKRDLLIKFIGNYHGHADLFLSKGGSGLTEIAEATSAGLPHENVQHTISLPYNDIKAFLTVLSNPAIAKRVAAVIVEPVAGNMGVVSANPAFLQELRTKTKEIGALLIFDEVISGFRVGLRGAQKEYGIVPDLTCLGKIIGGGFPVAAFGGRSEIMNLLAPLGPVYQAGTLSGNPVAMAAGLEALNLLVEGGDALYADLAHKTNIITVPVRQEIARRDLPCCLHQAGSMFTLFFGQRQIDKMEEALNQPLFNEFFKFLFNHGILIPPSQYETCFVSTAHSQEHLEKMRDLIIQFLHNV